MTSMPLSSTIVVTGGTPLKGVVTLGGAKNASYKLMIASILADSPSRILNLPLIADVNRVAKIIEELGGQVTESGPRTMVIDPTALKQSEIKLTHGEASRASTLFVGPLLTKFRRAVVPLPGGDKIGKRPLGRHLDGLEKLGVKWRLTDQYLEMEASELKGTTYRFDKNTHTGTETIMMAAVMAEGKTILENAALEPEIDDLISFLNEMGARIRRRAFKVIEIEGVPSLHGAIYKVMPDRNEAVSYACAAISTKGDIVIENARHQDLTAFLDKLAEAGAGYEIGNYGIRFFYRGPLRATDVMTEIHPGFMTDWQPLWATLIAGAQGTSIIHETVMQNRFQYVADLAKMGAKIEKFDPEVAHPDQVYNFDWQDHRESDIHAIKITGPTEFQGGEFEVHDLRAGATILLAAIGGHGTTILHHADQIDRGYEQIDQKLAALGAKIVRQN